MLLKVLLISEIFSLFCSVNSSPGKLAITRSGAVRGYVKKSQHGDEYVSYLGIPYAKPPVGPLRFKDPVPAPDWSNILDATEEPPACIQNYYNRNYKNYSLTGSEDCLYINVFTKGNLTKSLPVLVWFYGGAFKRGSSTIDLYGPEHLLEGEVVLVTLNYRVGALGFLSTGDEECAGNWGLKDQTLALQWVRNNIFAFGGDRNQVTIFGQSAGGASVHYHMLSPKSKGLFHQAISQSGTSLCNWSYDEKAPSKAKKLATLFDCPVKPHRDMIQCLREKSAEDIVIKMRAFVEWSLDDPISPFAPMSDKFMDDPYLPDNPRTLIEEGKVAQVPWMLGITTSESAFRVAELMLEPDLVKDLDDNFNQLIPMIFDYRHLTSDPEGIAKKIREFYFADRSVGQDLQDLLSMYSDRFISHGVYEAARLHAVNSTAPIYFYVLSYRGRHTLVTQYIGPLDDDYGVSHGDDLMYLFSGTVFPELKPGDPERSMSEKIVGIFTNFARNGSVGDLPWQPLTPDEFTFLDIQGDLVASTDFPYSRMDFWTSLGLYDSGVHGNTAHDEL